MNDFTAQITNGKHSEISFQNCLILYIVESIRPKLTANVACKAMTSISYRLYLIDFMNLQATWAVYFGRILWPVYSLT